MSKVDELNKLFKEWQDAQENEADGSLAKTISGCNIKKDFFEIDGIIDEDAYSSEVIKVLFISAEANANDYNAKKGVSKTDYRSSYSEYFKNNHDDWKGKMRERICGIYKYLTKQNGIPLHQLANRFAVMDINKRGGMATIDKGKHLVEYTRLYKNFISKEIEIINPDVIVLVGVNLCKLRIMQELGCREYENKCFFDINGKEVPILLSLQTANVQFQAKRYPPIEERDNRTIGILCSYLKKEIEKYHIWETYFK